MNLRSICMSVIATAMLIHYASAQNDYARCGMVSHMKSFVTNYVNFDNIYLMVGSVAFVRYVIEVFQYFYMLEKQKSKHESCNVGCEQKNVDHYVALIKKHINKQGPGEAYGFCVNENNELCMVKISVLVLPPLIAGDVGIEVTGMSSYGSMFVDQIQIVRDYLRSFQNCEESFAQKKIHCSVECLDGLIDDTNAQMFGAALLVALYGHVKKTTIKYGCALSGSFDLYGNASMKKRAMPFGNTKNSTTIVTDNPAFQCCDNASQLLKELFTNSDLA